MAGKTNANIGFEKQLWDAACVLWGHIPAAEYRKVIIGLIFLRYISAAFDKRYQELIAEGDGFEDDRDAYEMDNVFFVPEEARWSNIASKAHTPEIGTIMDNAMRAIEAENKKLKNVLPKNYASPDLDKRILGDVVDIFTNNIDMSDTTASEDLLGRTYEYCIAQFAEKEGVGGGEFYTPSSVVKTLVSILRPFDNCRVYDCCCGSERNMGNNSIGKPKRHLREGAFSCPNNQGSFSWSHEDGPFLLQKLTGPTSQNYGRAGEATPENKAKRGKGSAWTENF